MLRLLNLPKETQRLLSEGAISAGHARALLALKDPDAAARRIVEEGWTVRDVERLAQREASGPPDGAKARKPSAEKDADTRAIEKTLSDALGLSVAIHHQGESGELRIRYKTLEQLDRLCKLLTQ